MRRIHPFATAQGNRESGRRTHRDIYDEQPSMAKTYFKQSMHASACAMTRVESQHGIGLPRRLSKAEALAKIIAIRS
jgi:hypothetical protein